ncbi:Insulinase family protein [Klebsormidium nitens]|uniref:Insulinase family protein n=1 Tax=Klebsormidium nitens TaxID=105231 RepID=A0A1Y1HUR8_KLENI|nr:Insulinase family protein [Klebsormidium nitens]|eukprot:GAQ79598.1 Insulinase family protein [Klebsormidium nitens]
MVEVKDGVVLQPRSDKRAYRWVRLENELQALLISDPETDKAAAAMDVKAGYFLDPPDLSGLAHFLEHMLFYSSAKYPEEDSYSKYLTEHGGRSNAYTSSEDTNYHFDVNAEFLEEALDRFAQFFIGPLLSEDATSREMKAVDSENSKNLTSDAWRFNQLQKHLSKESNPFHKFGTGSLETLDVQPKACGKNTRDELIKFYTAHYSANLMRLVVYGKDSLDVLQSMVVDKFSAVKNTSKSTPQFSEMPLDAPNLQILIRGEPVTEGHNVEFLWPISPEMKKYKAAASRYLGHLLGHEGDGSLFALLKQLGWAASLSAGEGDGNPHYAFFAVNVELTEEGQKHVQEVAAFVFQYIAVLKEKGVQDWIFKEVQSVCETKFHFAEKSSPFQYVTGIATSLQLYPVEDCLAARRLPRTFDAAAIHEVLDALTPANVRIFWTSKEFTDQLSEKEPWYGTKYSVEKLGPDRTDAWTRGAPDVRLHLPAPNEFIPTDFALKAPVTKTEQPALVSETPLSRLWFKPDTKFQIPKAFIALDFICPESYISPETAVLTRIFAKLLVDYLNEYAYYAEIAGLNYTIHNTASGFQVFLSGYNHKLATLGEKILDKIVTFQVKEERFTVIKAQVKKDYQNFKYEQPYQQAMYNASLLLEHKRWHMDEYLAVLPHLHAADLAAFVPRLLSRVFVEAFIAGNWTATEAKDFTAHMEATLQQGVGSRPLFPAQHVERRVVQLEARRPHYHASPILNPKDENSAVDIYFQVGPDESRSNVLLELFLQTAKRDVFYQLRSVEQLGYIVFLMGRNDFTVRGAQFIIQSNVKNPTELDERVENFLNLFSKTLGELTEEDFKVHVETLAATKLEKHKNLGEEFSFFWREIDEGSLAFDRVKTEVAALISLRRQELLDFYETFIRAGAPSRRKLSVQIFGGPHIAALEKLSAPPNGSALENGLGGLSLESQESGAEISGEEGCVPNGSPSETSVSKDIVNGVANGGPAKEVDTGSGGSGEMVRIEDIAAFKRARPLYNSVKGRSARLSAL